MPRIFFKQQKPFSYMPLRCGLDLITKEELAIYNKKLVETCESFANGDTYGEFELCKKIYTTRNHKLKLSEIYYVVEGSRYKAIPVEPRIEFRVTEIYPFDLKNMLIYGWETLKSGTVWGGTNILDKDGYTFPEMDLGIRYSTLENLRDELLKLNPKDTINTVFYIHSLEVVI